MHDFSKGFRTRPSLLPPGEYAMWFPSTDEPLFAPSLTRQNIGCVYEALNGITTYVLADILRRYEGNRDPARRFALPDDQLVLTILSPDDQVFALSVSKEKGIRLHFNRSTSALDRNRILAAFKEYCGNLRGNIVEAGFPFDEASESPPIEWWHATEHVAHELEEKFEPLEGIGILTIR